MCTGLQLFGQKKSQVISLLIQSWGSQPRLGEPASGLNNHNQTSRLRLALAFTARLSRVLLHLVSLITGLF